MGDFGRHLRRLRLQKGFTLRSLAEVSRVDFTYLSKIENGKLDYYPSANTIRAFARALDIDSLELLRLADKVPPELESMTRNIHSRRFLERAEQVAAPDDWKALLDLLEQRVAERQEEA